MFKSYMTLAIIVIATAAGDYALKMASGKASPFTNVWFLHGALLYAFTAIGWIMLMQSYSLAQIGVLYSSATILALTGLGYFLFEESLSARQLAGVGAALIAVMLVDQ